MEADEVSGVLVFVAHVAVNGTREEPSRASFASAIAESTEAARTFRTAVGGALDVKPS